MKRFALAWTIAACAVALVAGAADGGQRRRWWNTAWKHRLWFEFPAPASPAAGRARGGAPGGERGVGVVEFLDGGRTAPDGADLRVVGMTRTPLAFRVLGRRDSDDRARVAFELAPGATHYALYFGNPRAKKEKPLELTKGLLLETFEYRGGDPNNLAGMRDILKRADGSPWGADFVPNVFHGHNPFGPSDRFVSRYTGRIMCPENGTYTFATSSDNASFLLVDGKLVVQWPGWHGAVRDARHNAKVGLRRGAHDFEYLHVNREDTSIAVAAWQPPSGRRIVRIPPKAFGEVARGKFVRAEVLGGRAMPHFEGGVAGECWFNRRYVYRAAFRDATGDAPPNRKTWWDFGDGLAATGRAVEHVYVRPGVYEVTMTTTVLGRPYKVTNRVRVERLWRMQTKDVAEPPDRHARIVREYDFSKLDGKALETAGYLFKAAGDDEAKERLLREIVTRPGEVSQKIYFEAVVFLVKKWRASAAARPEALKLLDRAEAVLAKNVRLRARVHSERGDVLLFYEKDLDAALGEYDKVVGRFAGRLEDHVVRITKIRIGDIHRKKGDFEKARASYADAARFRLHGVRGDPRVRRGLLIQVAEQELARRRPDAAAEALDILAWEFPLEKLRGPASVLRARSELARKNPAEALVQLDDLLRVAPDSNSAAEALFMAARIERKLGRTADAVRRYEQIVKNHKDSPRAADAKELLESVRGGR
jgi:tetratricopeptide (TPR) repeat protein